MYYTHQMRRPESDAELLKVRIQYTAKGGGGCMKTIIYNSDETKKVKRIERKPMLGLWIALASAILSWGTFAVVYWGLV